MKAVARIFRHPIKALGVEAVDAVSLTAGSTLPFDRVWAVAHEAAQPAEAWRNCNNFIRGAKSASLMAITATMDEQAGRITLRHPDRPEITLDPTTEGAALVDWVRPLCNPDRAAPSHVVRIDGRGMTDSEFPSVAILSHASLRALEERAGRPLDPRRFRGNIWADGCAPWEEFGWVGRRLSIGEAEFEVRQPITRCVATHVDPSTGQPDTDILGLLEANWDHRDFGVYAVVTRGGRVSRGDEICLH